MELFPFFDPTEENINALNNQKKGKIGIYPRMKLKNNVTIEQIFSESPKFKKFTEWFPIKQTVTMPNGMTEDGTNDINTNRSERAKNSHNTRKRKWNFSIPNNMKRGLDIEETNDGLLFVFDAPGLIDRGPNRQIDIQFVAEDELSFKRINGLTTEESRKKKKIQNGHRKQWLTFEEKRIKLPFIAQEATDRTNQFITSNNGTVQVQLTVKQSSHPIPIDVTSWKHST